MRVMCETQRTDEWFAAKSGRVSASDAKLALAGKQTKGRINYIQKLADDLEGIPDFEPHDTKPWFERGVFYEEWARGWYSFSENVDVVETGFVVHDEYSWLGCSPDGLIGDDGLVEFKFRHNFRTFEENVRNPNPVLPQIQTQMFVTGRDWCDYVNYWRSEDQQKERGDVQRIKRDDHYIHTVLFPAFLELWQDIQTELAARGLQTSGASG